MKELRNFFTSSVNFVTAFIALIPSVILWIIKPDGTIPTSIFIVVLLVCFLLLWLLIITIMALNDKMPKYSFSILSCTETLCLCSPNPSLSHDSIVSFYLTESGFENLIGYGIISNIQSNGFIQIEPHDLPNTVLSDHEDPFIRLLSKYRKNIIIKPIVTKKILDNINI